MGINHRYPSSPSPSFRITAILLDKQKYHFQRAGPIGAAQPYSCGLSFNAREVWIGNAALFEVHVPCLSRSTGEKEAFAEGFTSLVLCSSPGPRYSLSNNTGPFLIQIASCPLLNSLAVAWERMLPSFPWILTTVFPFLKFTLCECPGLADLYQTRPQLHRPADLHLQCDRDASP